jgi:hypothetical protein
MRKLLSLVVAIPLLFGPSAFADETSQRADSQAVGSGCSQPVPQRSYTDDQLVYSLAVDLTNCAWWDRSPIQLEADLDRTDGTEGHGAGSGTLCGVAFAIRPDNGEQPPTETATPKSGICEVQVALEHPPVEAAYYRGEVSFPWDGGRRTLSFTAVCGPPPGCLDLPVDAMPALAPVGDMIDGDGSMSPAD